MNKEPNKLNKLQYIQNFSKLYDRMQIIKSEYVPNDYKAILYRLLLQRESAFLAEYDLTCEDVDETLDVYENCLRDTINAIKRSYTICQIAIGLMKKFSPDTGLLFILQNYKFEKHFHKYFKSIENNRQILPDNHFLSVPLAIILDICHQIVTDSSDTKKLLGGDHDDIELDQIKKKFDSLLNKITLRGMSEIKHSRHTIINDTETTQIITTNATIHSSANDECIITKNDTIIKHNESVHDIYDDEDDDSESENDEPDESQVALDDDKTIKNKVPKPNDCCSINEKDEKEIAGDDQTHTTVSIDNVNSSTEAQLNNNEHRLYDEPGKQSVESLITPNEGVASTLNITKSKDKTIPNTLIQFSQLSSFTI